MSEQCVARIVANPPGPNGWTRTQGTKIMVGNVELKGVTKVELVCGMNDVWRARIDMMVQPPGDLSALAVFHRPNPLQRLWRWIRDAAMRPATGFGPG